MGLHDNNEIKIYLNTADKIKDFCNTVKNFESDIDLYTLRGMVDAKSILGIHTLDLSQDTYVKIISDSEAERVRFAKEMARFKE